MKKLIFNHFFLPSFALLMIIVASFGIVYILPFTANKMQVSKRLHAPDFTHLFGTDELGRDILARVLLGGQYTLGIALSVAIGAVVLGAIIGVLAGYYRRCDYPIMRLCDAMMAFPDILLGIALVSLLGAKATNVVIALILVYIPRVARVVRSACLVIREQYYIDAARTIGLSDWRIIINHLMPNLVSSLMVQFSFIFAYSILAEAGLSFLGIGVSAETPTWGTMIASAVQYTDKAIWCIIFPGLAIIFTALSLQLLGDALRDFLDPKLKKISR